MKMMIRVTSSAAAFCAGAVMVGCVHGQSSAVKTSETAVTAVAAVAKADRDAKYDKPGFFTVMDSKDGRLWVFEEGSADLAAFLAKGKPARHVLRPGAGPNGLTLKSTESETILAYVASKPGFYTKVDSKDGRLWIFKDGSEDLAAFLAKGNPARHVLRPGAGPLGLTLKATESDTILEYVASKPGFYTKVDSKDGRLWIFKDGSEDLAKFMEKGNPARHVLRPGAGPLGLTLKATESDTILEYAASKPGFHVSLDKDGRIWIFEEGSESLASYKEKGKPARHVVRPAAGPFGTTIKAVEFAVLDAYQAAK